MEEIFFWMVGGLVIAALGVFPLVALVVQVFRDVRGKRRNLRGSCYACASSRTPLLPIVHYKGNTFMYCVDCVKRQEALSRALGYLAVVVLTAAVVGWLTLRS